MLLITRALVMIKWSRRVCLEGSKCYGGFSNDDDGNDDDGDGGGNGSRDKNNLKHRQDFNQK